MPDQTIEMINRLKEGTDMAEQKKPFIVNPNSIQDFIVTALRYLGTIIAGFGAIAGLVGKGDLAGLTEFFQGSAGYTFIAAIFAVGLGGYGAYKAYSNKERTVSIISDDRTDVPSAVAVLATPAEAKEMGLTK